MAQLTDKVRAEIADMTTDEKLDYLIGIVTGLLDHFGPLIRRYENVQRAGSMLRGRRETKV